MTKHYLNELSPEDWRKLDPARICVTIDPGPDHVVRIAKLRKALERIVVDHDPGRPIQFNSHAEALHSAVRVAREALEADKP